MSLSPYKQNQGRYARGAAGAGFAVLIIFAGWRLAEMIGLDSQFKVLGLGVPYGALWGLGFVVVACLLASVLVFGFQTGWGAFDKASRGFVDLLIDTQGELQKVAWPGREELKVYTGVVIGCILILGVFLYVVDMAVSYAMSNFGVLPG
jgi:preprotein translocase SecE subunit